MQNNFRGLDINNETIWEMRQLNSTYDDTWMGTGKDHMLIIHTDAKSGIEFYLSYYPKTYAINGVVDNMYRFTLPSQSEHKSILDGILKELGL